MGSLVMDKVTLLATDRAVVDTGNKVCVSVCVWVNSSEDWDFRNNGFLLTKSFKY